MRLLRRGGSDHSALLAELRAAFDADDHRRLSGLLRDHEHEILDAFPSWWPPREPEAWDPDDLERYTHAMAFVANVFAVDFGHPELLAGMAGGDPGQPLLVAQHHVTRIQELLRAGRYAEAEAAAETFAAEAEGWHGSGVAELETMALVSLGRARLDGGSPARAIGPLERAARIKHELGDAEAVSLYTRWLFDAYRYLGDARSAATWLERSIEAAEARHEPDVPWLRRELAIVRAGEPLVRMVGVLGDRRYEVDEIRAALGAAGEAGARVRFDYARNRPTIAAAERATAEGARLASAGRLQDALALFDTASAIDPFDPSPRYNAGVVLLELGRYADARDAFEATDALAPGWFFCRRYAWLAQALVDGRVDPRVATLLIRTGDDHDPPAERRRLLTPAQELAPDLAWLHLHLAGAYTSEGRQADAEAELRRGLEGVADDDVRAALLVRLAMIRGAGSDERQRLAREAIGLEGCLLDATIAKLGLRNDETNPITRWQTELARADGLLKSGEHVAAADIGASVLRELGAAAMTSGLEEEPARALRCVGSGAFCSGRVADAIEPLEQALRLYQDAKLWPELDLVLDLFDVHRYLGDAERAAEVADVLASGFASNAGPSDPVALFYRRQAGILRAGEPLVRVIARIDHMRYELGDIPTSVDGGAAAIGLEYRRNRPAIDRATRSLRTGLEAATAGQFGAALAAFAESSAIDPFGPGSAYESGVVLLGLGRWPEARAAFEMADALAPDIFSVRRYAWVAAEAEAGRIGPEAVTAIVRCDDARPASPADVRLQLLDAALARDPDMGILHLLRGRAEVQLGRTEAAVASYRRGLGARTDPGTRSALSLELGIVLGVSTPDGRAALESAVREAGNLMATARATVALGLHPEPAVAAPTRVQPQVPDAAAVSDGAGPEVLG